MGLLIDVFRSAGMDCTNGGVSSKHDTLCVVNVDGPFQPLPGRPAVLLESHVAGCLRIVPAFLTEKGEWRPAREQTGHNSMMGGNFGATSDGRFAAACLALLGRYFYGAVAIHDRTE